MAIIPRITEEGKNAGVRLPEGALVAVSVVLLCSLSFGLGYLSGKEAQTSDVVIQGVPAPSETTSGVTPMQSLQAAPKESISSAPVAPEVAPPSLPAGGQYVASKKGTKYHLPWCAGAKAMKEENKVWFNSKTEAEAAGYTPAANCKGI